MASIAPAGWKAKCNARRDAASVPFQSFFNYNATESVADTGAFASTSSGLQRAADVPKIVSYVLIDAAAGTSAFVVQLLYPSRSEAKRKILFDVTVTMDAPNLSPEVAMLDDRIFDQQECTRPSSSGSNNDNNNDNSGGGCKKWRISLSSSTSSGADDMVDSFLISPLPSVNFCIELSFPESVQFDAYMMSQTMPGANLIAYSEKNNIEQISKNG